MIAVFLNRQGGHFGKKAQVAIAPLRKLLRGRGRRLQQEGIAQY
jgi:hypothetical protein